MEDDFETNGGWTVGEIDDDATTGVWDRADPEYTEAQPEDDHSPSPGTDCFVTDHNAGFSQGDYDVDGGKTTLLSPTIDLLGLDDVTISYYRWYSNDTGAAPNADVFMVDISSNGGGSWANAETVGPSGSGTSGGWFYHEFQVADFVALTDQVRVRFVASDESDGSLVEAAVDDFLVTSFGCEPVILPTISGAASVVTHGSVGDFESVMDAGTIIEHRASGVTKLVVAFDMAMDPATTIPANVAATGLVHGAYTGAVGTSLAGGDQLTITFDPALEDVDRYVVALSGMTSLGGAESADPTFEVIALEGDVNHDLATNTTDASILKLRFGLPVDGTTWVYDYNNDGEINTTDFSQVKLKFGNSAP